MFCINCGKKLVEGARFCPNCGAKVAAMQEEAQEKTVLPETEPAAVRSTQDIEAAVETEEKGIEDTFSSIFNVRGEFGKNVLFAGKDNIMHEEDIRRHYLNGNLSEKPLMVFQGNNYGLVITDQRIAWDYVQGGTSEIFLENIKTIGIYFEKIDGKEYDGILITGHDDNIYPLMPFRVEIGFIVKLRKFIYTIQKNYCSDSDDDKNTYFLTRICGEFKCYRSEYDARVNREVGNPTIQPSSERYQTAKRLCNIPDHEDIFLIQGFKQGFKQRLQNMMDHGFALCTSGFYYTTRLKHPEYIPWKEFSSLPLPRGSEGYGYSLGKVNLDYDIIWSGLPNDMINLYNFHIMIACLQSFLQ